MVEKSNGHISNHRPVSRHVTSPKWLLVGLVVLCIFAFFAFFAHRFGATSLEIDLKGKKISLNTKQLNISPEEIKHKDTQDFYVDSHNGFMFQKLKIDGWTSTVCKGVDQLLAVKGASLNEEVKKDLSMGLQTHPLGPMLREVEAIRFVSPETMDVEITDKSGNAIVDEVVNNIMNSRQFKELNLNEDEVKDFRKERVRALLGFYRLNFQNELIIYIYDKKKLAGLPIKHSLATFALVALAGVGMNVDQLAADAKTVLAGGSVTVRDVKIDGKTQDFRVDRLWLVTENSTYYYLVEIGFSPQTQSSMKVWSELEKALRSFSIVN